MKATYLDDNNTARLLGGKDINNTLLTYDDKAAVDNGNMLVMTSPFKRVLVQSKMKDGAVKLDGDNPLFTGIEVDDNGVVTNYGDYKAFANIYNNKEDEYNTVAFSPALPSYLVFTKEVQSTESIETTLSDYINKAIEADASFANGGYVIVDFESADYDVYAIPTWMMGTYVEGQAVTNWLYPATNIQ
jgi:hypothetical protein